MFANEMATVPQQSSLSLMDPYECVKINASVLSIMKGKHQMLGNDYQGDIRHLGYNVREIMGIKPL